MKLYIFVVLFVVSTVFASAVPQESPDSEKKLAFRCFDEIPGNSDDAEMPLVPHNQEGHNLVLYVGNVFSCIQKEFEFAPNMAEKIRGRLGRLQAMLLGVAKKIEMWSKNLRGIGIQENSRMLMEKALTEESSFERIYKELSAIETLLFDIFFRYAKLVEASSPVPTKEPKLLGKDTKNLLLDMRNAAFSRADDIYNRLGDYVTEAFGPEVEYDLMRVFRRKLRKLLSRIRDARDLKGAVVDLIDSMLD